MLYSYDIQDKLTLQLSRIISGEMPPNGLCRISNRFQTTVRIATHHTRAAPPLRGRNGVLSDAKSISIAEYIGVLIIALILGIAPQHSNELLTGNRAVRPKDVYRNLPSGRFR